MVWTIEANVTAGQHLYLTGEPVVLGCWKPGMAVLMSPTEHANLWMAEVKVISPSYDDWLQFLLVNMHIIMRDWYCKISALLAVSDSCDTF